MERALREFLVGFWHKDWCGRVARRRHLEHGEVTPLEGEGGQCSSCKDGIVGCFFWRHGGGVLDGFGRLERWRKTWSSLFKFG